MNIIRYAVMALAVSFASVAFGRLKLISWTPDRTMTFTEGSSENFYIQIPYSAGSKSYCFIYPIDGSSSNVSFVTKILADDCVGIDSEVVFEAWNDQSSPFFLKFVDGNIDYRFFNYWIIRSETPRWDVFTNGYSSVSDACTTTNRYLIEVDKSNDPLEITNKPPSIDSYVYGIGGVVEQYSVRTCSVDIVDYDPVICKWEIAGTNYVQEIYQYGEQGQFEFVQPIAFDSIGPHRLTVYAKDKDMSGWVHKLLKEFTVVEPSIEIASLVPGRNRIENGKLYVPEYLIVSGNASSNLVTDAIDYLKVKIPSPKNYNTTFIISVGDTYDGDLNLLSKANYMAGRYSRATKSLEVWIYSGDTESEEVYLVDADGTKETAKGIRISAVEKNSNVGTGYLDVCVTNCPPFIYMENQFMSYRTGLGPSTEVGNDSNSTSKWFVYDSNRDLEPQNNFSGREYIVTNKIISISGYMATAGIWDPYDDMIEGVLRFLWSPGGVTLTTRHYFQSIDKDGGVGEKYFTLTRIPYNSKWSIVK